ncbi:NosD domain-containing protein [Methanofollis fontis]|nr:NosD domain-containing protein [Methanofollis fontis]
MKSPTPFLIFCAFTLLLAVQGASAVQFECAPLNPAFVSYGEGGGAVASDALCSRMAGSLTEQSPYPLTGLVPAPALLVWPEHSVVSAEPEPLPAAFDLRDEGRVTPVRDQGRCGSCWAFATYASLESTLLTDTGIAWDFSENNMKNLCSNLYPEGFDVGPCGGGQAFVSTAYLARWSGPVNESDDPYLLPVPSPDSPTDCAPVVHVGDVTFLPPRDGPLGNDPVKRAIRDEGALWVGFNVNWSCFTDNCLTYYRPADGRYESDGGHAVALVGWDDAYPASNFTVSPPGDGAFIAKNSWGEGVGDRGYFYISYYEPELGNFWDENSTFVGDDLDFTSVLFTGEPVGALDHVYGYDPLGWTTSIGTGDATTLYGANLFTSDGYEDLRSVGFYTREPGTDYVVAVFRDIDTPPGNASGPVAWTPGTATLPGYHTVNLPAAVPLSPGQTFSVVLKIAAPTDTRSLVVEKPIEGYSSNATAAPGQSYVSVDGDDWEDLTDIMPDTNLCIKAFTTDALLVPQDYPTIQAAVDTAAAGETVWVESGTYEESVVVNTTITLLGIDTGEGLPVIDAGGNGSALSVLADGVNVEGFVLSGGGDEYGDAGLMVRANAAGIVGCIATENAGMGFSLWKSENSTLICCEANTNADDGMYISECSGTTLRDCGADDNGGNGIMVYSCSGTATAMNSRASISSGYDGTHGHTAHDIAPLFDDFCVGAPAVTAQEDLCEVRASDGGDSGGCIGLIGCDAGNNTGSGIYVSGSSSVLLDGCTATENEDGINIRYSENCTLTNNSMASNCYNFGLYGGSDADYVHEIDLSNTVDGKPVYYLRGATGNPAGDFADAGTIYAIDSVGLEIRGLTLSDNRYGVFFWNTTASTLEGVTARENCYGIRIAGSSAVGLDGCEAAENTDMGMYIHGCSAVEVAGCRATENEYDGIFISGSEGCRLSGNVMDGNHYNFGLDGWNDTHFIHEIDLSNTVDGKPVYYLLNATGNPAGDFADAGTIYAVNCTGLEIHDLILSNSYAGVYLWKSTGVTMDSILVTDDYYGITLGGCSAIAIQNCTAVGTDTGIDVYHSADCQISECIATSNNYYGIALWDAEGCDIDGCSVQDNGEFGMILDEVGNCSINGCLAQGNDYLGMFLMNAEHCSLQECSVSGGLYGIALWGLEDCQVASCTVQENDLMGILLGEAITTVITGCTMSDTLFGCGISDSVDCQVYLNSFCNASAAEYDSLDILWASPGTLTYHYGGRTWTSPMGNHWGKAYNGTDQNGDGIGDVPYAGDGFTDAYPLMETPDRYFFGDDGGDDDSGDIAAAGNLNPGDTATMHFSGSAVTGITLRAAERIDGVMIGIDPVTDGPDGLDGPVYQYLAADLTYTTDAAIAEAVFTFDVPAAWLEEQGLTPEGITLWRYHEGAWLALPTVLIGEEGGRYVYRATSPGFSYFAVAAGEAAEVAASVPPVEAEIQVITPPGAEAEANMPATAVPITATATPPTANPTDTPAHQTPVWWGIALTAIAALSLFRREA